MYCCWQHLYRFWRNNRQFAIREGSWKLVRQGGQPDELYDLARDIGESTNLAKIRPKIAARLSAALAAWNAELIDPVFPGDTGHQANIKKTPAKSKP